jgi:hypothetical protein
MVSPISTRSPQAAPEADTLPPAPEHHAEARPSRSRLRAIDWRPILLEAFFVVLGVVLALAANEWRQGVADRRSASTALASVREELQSNRALVLGAVQYHLRMTDTLAAIRRQAARGDGAASPSPDARIFSQGFVRPATLLSTAWETATTTDVVRHMAHDDVLALARIYEQQRRYAAQTDRIGGLIYGEIFARGTEGVLRNYANLGSIIAALAFRECELLDGYETALAQIGDSDPRRPLPDACRRMLRR